MTTIVTAVFPQTKDGCGKLWLIWLVWDYARTKSKS